MQNKAHDDELVMSLAELAMAQPPQERKRYLESACAHEPELLAEVWKYVDWEQRMQGFLLDPLFPLPVEAHPFEPGECLLRRFRIVREVAEGGMGVVYEAWDEKLDRRVAIKCAKPGHHRRLPPEARNATDISHPNVCKTYEIHTATTPNGEVEFLTMEYLEGETLASRLRRGSVPDEQARTIALQLCAGLAEAHRNRVIHGDLKSSNVILTQAGDTLRAVITDFGLARRPLTSQSAVPSGSLRGTPAYMAPELWRGEKASVASDIYALGVILHELVSGGRMPYAGDLPWLERPNARLAPVHPKWDRILGGCLHPDPARRFHSADEIAQALAPRSRRWLLGAAAAVVLAAVSGVVTYQQATAPQETVRLALLPVEGDRESAALSETLQRDTARQLAQLKGNARTGLQIIHTSSAPNASAGKSGATHWLRASLKKQQEKVILRAQVVDARSRANAKDWTALYAPAELRYAPVALAGVVTLAFRLPPAAPATVNAAAREDYQKGLALVRLDTGLDAALGLFQRAVSADPDSPLTHAGLADAQWYKYFATNDQLWLERATESLRQAELRNPDVARVRLVAGRLKANSALHLQAIADYRRAIELEPDLSDGYRRLGAVYSETNQLDEALAAYRRALEIEPQYYGNHQQLGSFYYALAKYDEALIHFRTAVEFGPDEPDARFALASAYMNLGRYTEAERELRRALDHRDTPNLILTLGVVLMYQSREREAIPYLLRFLRQQPNHYLGWMNLGTAYRRTKLETASERAIRRGLHLAELDIRGDPSNGYKRSMLAYFCARLGNRGRAESEVAQALQLAPSDADTRWMAAVTYEALGQREATLTALSAAPRQLLADLGRWPDVADLRRDPRFIQMLADYSIR